MSRRQDLPFALPGADPVAARPVPGSAPGVGDLAVTGSGPHQSEGRAPLGYRTAQPVPVRPALHLVDALYERVRQACDQDSALSGVELDDHARRIADTLLRKAKARS